LLWKGDNDGERNSNLGCFGSLDLGEHIRSICSRHSRRRKFDGFTQLGLPKRRHWRRDRLRKDERDRHEHYDWQPKIFR
jgi:hypothetical protein